MDLEYTIVVNFLVTYFGARGCFNESAPELFCVALFVTDLPVHKIIPNLGCPSFIALPAKA